MRLRLIACLLREQTTVLPGRDHEHDILDLFLRKFAVPWRRDAIRMNRDEVVWIFRESLHGDVDPDLISTFDVLIPEFDEQTSTPLDVRSLSTVKHNHGSPSFVKKQRRVH